jgi:hypothetical protein
MIQDRKGKFIQSLLMTFQKPTKREGPKMRDSDLLESRRRIEQRIDVVLGNLDNPTPNATGR